MSKSKFIKSILAVLALSLSACSSASDELFPEDSNSSDETSSSDLSTYNSSTYVTDGTFFKKKIPMFKEEISGIKALVEKRKKALEDMRGETRKNISDYKTTVAEINSKLQVGTTPSNPELLDKWREARAKLEKVNNTSFDLRRLAADIESDASMTDYMVDSINAAYRVKGATEDDHRKLKSLEEEAKGLSRQFTRFAGSVEDEASKQQDYVEREKHKLNELALAIKNGSYHGYGYGASSDPYTSSTYSEEYYEGSSIFGTEDEYAGTPAYLNEENRYGSSRFSSRDSVNLIKPTAEDRGRPLVVIDFSESSLDYEEPLYQAISRALERDPGARFEVVAVSPRRYSSSSRRNASKVAKSLNEMGLPATRISLASEMGRKDVSGDEVHIYYVK